MSSPFVLPKQFVLDQNGEPLMGAKLYFYEISTSTPKDTFIDAAMNTAHPNPLISDAYGVFPQIWLDESGTDYRVTLTDQFEVEQQGYPVDGLLSQVTPQDLLDAIITVDGSGSGLDADTLDGIDSTEFAQVGQTQTVTAEWAFNEQPTLFGIEMGFRNIPVRPLTAQHTLSLNDDGYCMSVTTGGIIIPVVSDLPFQIGPFPIGACVCFYNDSAVNQQITAETPATTTIRLAATGSTGTRTVSQHGLAVMYQVALNTWLVYGAGVT